MVKYFQLQNGMSFQNADFFLIGLIVRLQICASFPKFAANRTHKEVPNRASVQSRRCLSQAQR